MEGGDRAVRRTVDRTLLILTGLALAIVAFGPPAGGLAGHYGILGADGGRVPLLVDEQGDSIPRIDPAVNFPIPHRIDAVYIHHWDIARLGFPELMPSYAITWHGVLRIPEGGTYGFQIESSGEGRLRLDGRPIEMREGVVASRRLQAGLHPIEVDYILTDGDARIVLRWRPPGGDLHPIPSTHLGVDAEAFANAQAKRALRLLLLAAALLVGFGIILAARKGNVAAAGILERLGAGAPRLALGLILLLATSMLLHDYALVPFHNETADEYQHAWEGWNLLREGTPASWTAFPDLYPSDRVREFSWFGNHYAVVWPYFDHPPLFSVLVGAAGTIGSALRGSQPAGGPGYLLSTLPIMRLVPILLGLIGVLMVHRLARAYGASERAALLGTLVYAVLPSLVLLHRLVKAENLLVVLMMGAILLAHRHARTGRAIDALFVGLLCGLAIWTKATGVAVIAIVVVLLAAARRYRGAALAAAVTVGFVALYLLYAAAYDWDIFTSVVHAQATMKSASLDVFLDFLSGKVVVKSFGRGFYLFLLLAGAFALRGRQRAILLPIAIYVTLLAMTADYRVVYGWYRIPIAPFLCIAAGLYLEEMLEKADLYRVFPFAITAVVTGLLYAFASHPIATADLPGALAPLPISAAQSQAAVILFAVVALLPFVLRIVHERAWTRWLARGTTYVLLIVFVLSCVMTVGDLVETYALMRGIR